MRVSLIRQVTAPNRGTEKSAGIDFYVPNQLPDNFTHEVKYQESSELNSLSGYYITLKPGEDVLIPSGVRAEVPVGYMLMADNKSGVSTKQKLIVGAKIIDEDYQGEIGLHVINYSSTETNIFLGQKIVQLILVPVLYDHIEVVCDCDMHKVATTRGQSGYGSTGI